MTVDYQFRRETFCQSFLRVQSENARTTNRAIPSAAAMAVQMANRWESDRLLNHKITEHSAIRPINKYCKPTINSLLVYECISCFA